MNGVLLLFLVVLIVLPVSWFLSELQHRKWLRMLLGTASLLGCSAVAFLGGSLTENLNANSYFGYATKELIDSTLSELKAGNTDGVIAGLQQLQQHYRPTYENRAQYELLMQQAVSSMRLSRQEIDDHSP
jgi:hypothetical protein